MRYCSILSWALPQGRALMCLILSFKYQRLALYAFIIYMPFAGTVTYALGGNSLLQIAKDVFYVPALIGVYQFCKKNRLPIILPKRSEATADSASCDSLYHCAIRQSTRSNWPGERKATLCDGNLGR